LACQPATTPAFASDLISFFKALPDSRMRRGIRFPQWWMLLVAILSILSGQGSLVGIERFIASGFFRWRCPPCRGGPPRRSGRLG
jgi:hypothetical protein